MRVSASTVAVKAGCPLRRGQHVVGIQGGLPWDMRTPHPEGQDLLSRK